MFNNYLFIHSGFPNSLILYLIGSRGKTVVGGTVSRWNDQTKNNNDAIQNTGAAQPTDRDSYLTFDGGDNMVCANNSTLDITDTLTLYSKFSTVSNTNFLGLIDKFIGSTSGYALLLDANKKPQISAVFSKTTTNKGGATAVNTGAVIQVKATIECTRKFSNKRLICAGRQPQIYKENGIYYLFYDKWDGAQNNIYYRLSTSPYFADSTETLLISNRHYCSIMKDGSTYRLCVVDAVNEHIILYTSTTIGSGYTSQGNLVTFGDVYDSFALGDPFEIKIGATYFLYYSGFTGAATATICYATSATGASGSYTKNGTCLALGAAGAFDEDLIADPDVKLMPDGVTYNLFYTGFNSTNSKQQQAYATSTDGITWTKYSGNPIHYFTGESYESGLFGPNEPTALIEDGICRFWYTANNVDNDSIKIGYTQFALSNNQIVSGNETITVNVYVNGVLDGTETISGALGIDYIVNSNSDLYVGGDGASTNKFVGNIYEAKIYDSIV